MAANSDRTSHNRTELVWAGKRTHVERVALPFQLVETINAPRGGDMFSALQDGDAWRNKLIWGDNKLVTSSLAHGDPGAGIESLAGKVDLIYIDPPFDTGADFTIQVEIGDERVPKEPSMIEQLAYRDTWGRGTDSYLQMMFERLVIMRDLLAPSGLMYVHCDVRVNSLLRMLLDELFGRDNLRNEIIWCYRGGGTPENDFAQKHDTIYRYSKGDSYYFNVDPVRIPYSAASSERLRHQANVFRGEKVYKNYRPNELGKHPEDWWTIQPIMPSEKQERSISYYPTQKPVEVLQRIVDSSCPEGGLVLDAFCGSGTTLAVAAGLRVGRDDNSEKYLYRSEVKRRWIGCDLGRFAIHTSRKRLLELGATFDVLNLGKYERSHWQGVTLGDQLRAYVDLDRACRPSRRSNGDQRRSAPRPRRKARLVEGYQRHP